jgi:hypothetical protein
MIKKDKKWANYFTCNPAHLMAIEKILTCAHADFWHASVAMKWVC